MDKIFKSMRRTSQPDFGAAGRDTFKQYYDGLRRLLERMGKKHPKYAEALLLQARLIENMSDEIRFGSSPDSSSKRAEILFTLNRLSIETIDISFNELCLLSITYEDMEQAPAKLQDYLLYTKRFKKITQQQAEGFVGREFLFKQVIDGLRNPIYPNGYILIEGEPGIGKTTFSAAMIRRYRWIHHYISLQEGIIHPRQFLENVCAQLILRYHLPTSLLEKGGTKLDSLFIELLETAVAIADEKRVVILLDALDEASDKELPDEYTNCLLLPRCLPNGAFIVATTRPPSSSKYQGVGRANLVVDKSQKILPRGDDPKNWSNYEQALLNVTDGICEVVEETAKDASIDHTSDSKESLHESKFSKPLPV